MASLCTNTSTRSSEKNSFCSEKLQNAKEVDGTGLGHAATNKLVLKILIQGIVPLCSWQYERVFNTTRVPGDETDRIVHYGDSKHVVLYCKGRYFKVLIYHRGRILRPCELEVQMQQILNDISLPAPGEEKLAALTGGERTHWSKTRKEHFFKGANRQSLDAIEKAAFVVALDDFPYEFDEKDPSKLDKYGRILLHGNGCNRWFDKSFTLCIGSNGRIGFNAEHSWADAAVMSHLWEHTVLEEARMLKDGNSWADAPVLGHLWEVVLGTELRVGYGYILVLAVTNTIFYMFIRLPY